MQIAERLDACIDDFCTTNISIHFLHYPIVSLTVPSACIDQATITLLPVYHQVYFWLTSYHSYITYHIVPSSHEAKLPCPSCVPAQVLPSYVRPPPGPERWLFVPVVTKPPRIQHGKPKITRNTSRSVTRALHLGCNLKHLAEVC